MNFYQVDGGFSRLSTAELDAVALSCDPLCCIGYGYASRGSIETRPDGWSARWINTGGMGNHGRLVLVGTTTRTRALVRQGKLRFFQQAGLTSEQAHRVYWADAGYKFELLPILVAVLADAAQMKAFLSHPGSYGPGSGRREWYERWSPLSEIGLSAPREAELAKMVCAAGGKRELASAWIDEQGDPAKNDKTTHHS